MAIIISLIHILSRIFIFIIILQVILSFFMSPYHPIRRTLDSIAAPLLNPIRKIIPPMANIDFSPVVLVILIQLLEYLLTSLLTSLG